MLPQTWKLPTKRWLEKAADDMLPDMAEIIATDSHWSTQPHDKQMASIILMLLGFLYGDQDKHRLFDLDDQGAAHVAVILTLMRRLYADYAEALPDEGDGFTGIHRRVKLLLDADLDVVVNATLSRHAKLATMPADGATRR